MARLRNDANRRLAYFCQVEGARGNHVAALELLAVTLPGMVVMIMS